MVMFQISSEASEPDGGSKKFKLRLR